MSDPVLPPPPPPVPAPLPPMGWYADPSGEPMVRWWDGTTWTEHTSAFDFLRPAPGYSPHPYGATVIAIGDRTVALSGWWRRVGGSVLDGLILAVPLIIVELVILGSSITSFGNTNYGTPRVALHAVLLSTIISLVVTNAYSMILLRTRGQTVGMMATGIKAVDLDGAPELSWRQVWRRALALYLLTGIWGDAWLVAQSILHGLGSSVSSFSFFTLIGTALSLVTYLWPLGSARNQTLQDLAAHTVVIRK